MYQYCRGSMQTAHCRRRARYLCQKSFWNVALNRMNYQAVPAPLREAMFCKQHADKQCQRYNLLLEEARSETVLTLIVGHLERLEADGIDGLEAEQVYNRPALVHVFDTDDEAVYDMEEVLTTLAALEDAVGSEATWKALEHLPERMLTTETE